MEESALQDLERRLREAGKDTMERAARICEKLLADGVDEQISVIYPAHNRKAILTDAIEAIRKEAGRVG